MESIIPGKNLFDNSDGDLKHIVQVVDRLKALNNAISKHLPGKLSEHCLVANLQNGKLTITLDSSTWASKFYYEKPSLLAKLRQTPEFAGISHIDHRVDPNMFKQKVVKEEKAPEPATLTHDSEGALDALIAQSEGELKEKLIQLKTKFKAG